MIKFIDNATVRPGESTVLRMQQLSLDARETLLAVTVQTFHMLWDDPTSLQEKLNVMGVNAVDVFNIHRLTIAYLLQVGAVIAAEDYTPPYEFTENPDGTITAKIGV